MSETSGNSGVALGERRSFRVTMMHHPCAWVPDLDEAERWFLAVFGCSSKSISEVLDAVPYVRPDWPRNYSFYTAIRDVFLNSVEPARFVIDGRQPYPTVDEPHLKDFAWSVERHDEAYRALKHNGIRVTNSLGVIVDGDDPPTAPHTAPNNPAPFFTLPQETGLRYHFYPAGPFPIDGRSQPGWVLGPVSDEDPLGIERCSHHTILTKQPERALGLFVEALGAEVVHEGRNELLGATSTYVHLGGTTLEYAVPDDGTPAHDDWQAREPSDTYHAITWKVADLAVAERHLEAQGVRVRARSTNAIVTDPATSLGIPWGFSTALVDGDPRG
jgi:catechol 2,3-dioxygenase-like lactoylglutathione lyase family enzyme